MRDLVQRQRNQDRQRRPLSSEEARPAHEDRAAHQKDAFDSWYNPQQETSVANLAVTLSNKTYFEGTVTSPDDKPVANAPIRADNGPKQGDGVRITNVWTEITSDENGHYRLYVSPDHYDIQARVPKVGARESIHQRWRNANARYQA